MTRPADAEFASVYDDCVWQVYGFFGYRLSSRDDAEDLTQQTFERALRSWGRYEPERATRTTWLLAIARNLLIDHYRRRSTRREEPATEALEEIEAEQGSDPAAAGVSPELAIALDELTSRQRELIALRYGGGLTGPEIASLTGLSLANVQQILSRSLRQLRGTLTTSSGRPASLRSS